MLTKLKGQYKSLTTLLLTITFLFIAGIVSFAAESSDNIEDHDHNWSNESGKCSICGETHEHEWGSFEQILSDWGWSSVSYHKATCNICGYKTSKQSHYFPDLSGKCVCGFTCFHNEDYTHEDNGDGTHTSTCSDCGKPFIRDHDWSNKDGICADCSATCDHPDFDEHGNCTTCKYNECQHDWSNKDGVCYICGTECEHAYDPENINCPICGMKCPHTGAYIWERTDTTCEFECETCWYWGIDNHNWKDGTCTICGYTCTHTNSETGESYIDYSNYASDSTGHWYVCLVCGEKQSDVADHNWSNKDGKCTICGYSCEHSAGFKTEFGNSGFIDYCRTCGYVCNHEDSYFVQDETYSDIHDEVCDYCGMKMLSTHSYEYEDLGDGTHHVSCSVCGLVDETEEHKWNSKNGKCRKCGIDCDHLDIDQYGTCLKCSYNTWEHDWSNKDGICADCGYVCDHTDARGEYISATECYVTCDTCGFDKITDHKWEGDKYPRCTRCSYNCWHESWDENDEYINYIVYSYDKEGHWEKCRICNSIQSGTSSHFYTDDVNTESTGKCLVCDYECEHTDGYNYSINSGDNTHDVICKTCGYIVETIGHSIICTPSENEGHHMYTCDVCGYIQDEGIHIYIDEDNIVSTGTCLKCEYAHNHSENWDTTGTCEICSYECPHNNTDYIVYKDNKDTTTHTKQCITCGLVLEESENHFYTNDDITESTGTCLGCGYECGHTAGYSYEHYENTRLRSISSLHTKTCNTCTYAEVIDCSFNSYEYKCDYCSYIESHDHVYADSICTLCGEAEEVNEGGNGSEGNRDEGSKDKDKDKVNESEDKKNEDESSKDNSSSDSNSKDETSKLEPIIKNPSTEAVITPVVTPTITEETTEDKEEDTTTEESVTEDKAVLYSTGTTSPEDKSKATYDNSVRNNLIILTIIGLSGLGAIIVMKKLIESEQTQD